MEAVNQFCQRLYITAVGSRTSLVITAAVFLLTITILSKAYAKKKLNLPPSIPGGWPLLGNIRQLREGNPHRTFTEWAKKHGPIFHVKIGSINSVVINSADLAKEVLVTTFDSISSRRLHTSFTILSEEKTAMVALCDYGPHYNMLKKLLVGNLLGTHAQKANRPIRENVLKVMVDDVFATIDGQKSAIVDVRQSIRNGLFAIAMNQSFGYTLPEGVHVPELGRFVKNREVFEALVHDPMKSPAINIDWRNFFPSLSFVPNNKVENAIYAVRNKKAWILDAMIDEHKKNLKTRGPTGCFADRLLTAENPLSPLQIQTFLWESIIASVDTVYVSTEWTMYEIARNPKSQERLYEEMKSVVGDRMVTEDDLHKIPLLTAIIQENLRVHPPIPILLPRYVHEDITIGGYDVPKDWDVLVNVYGINMDPKLWTNPENWDPDRMLKADNASELAGMGIKDFSILTFGGGRRRCTGMQQALTVLSMVIASFVLHFWWSMPPEVPNKKTMDEDTRPFFSTHKLHPLMAVAKPRLNSRLTVSDDAELEPDGSL